MAGCYIDYIDLDVFPTPDKFICSLEKNVSKVMTFEKAVNHPCMGESFMALYQMLKDKSLPDDVNHVQIRTGRIENISIIAKNHKPLHFRVLDGEKIYQ